MPDDATQTIAMQPPAPIKGAREERVVHVADLEVRVGEGLGGPTITGHPLLYNVWSEDLGGFRERVRPGATTKTLQESDIRALFNHDPNYVIGRNRAGTAEFSEDKKGVFMRASPPATTWAADLIVSMERKDIDQMSFGFRTIRDEWTEPKKAGGLWDRDLLEIAMSDASVVTFPAYTQTDAQVRTVLAQAGLDFEALSALLARAQRGVTPSASDMDLLNGSIAALRSFLPEAPVALPLVAEDHPSEAQAGRSLAHFRALLELEAAALN